MKLRRISLSLFVLAWLPIAEAHAAVVAVMPVRGVNLSPGECDAIGALFAAAFARETHIEVLPPVKTGPALEQSQTSLAAAEQLQAAEYIELGAIQLDHRVTLTGIRFDRSGREIYRAETVAPSLDQVDIANATLARALAWKQPVPPAAAAARAVEPIETPGPARAEPAPRGYPKALGVKAGIVQPVALGRSFYPMAMVAFDARFGTRDYFVELGAGFALSQESQSVTDKASLRGLFVELGGSVYLSDGSIAPYVGGGISPRLWAISGSAGDDGLKCALYGQAGVTLTRDSRFRIYAELRLSQNVIGIPEFASDGTTTPNRTVLGTYYPTELALQMGVGW